MQTRALAYLRREAAWIVLLVLVFAIASMPLLYVIRAAFMSETRVGLGNTFDLTALLNVYLTGEYLYPLFNAVYLSVFVTIASLIIGVAMAVIIGRTDIRFKGTWDLLIVMPLFLSPFTGLIAWVALGSERTGFINVAVRTLLSPFSSSIPALINIWSFGGIVWLMVLFFCPFAYLFTLGSLRSIDSSMEEAARTTGASYRTVLARVTLPLCGPAIFASGMLIFVLSAEMYTIPGIIGTPVNFVVLPWKMLENMTVFPMKQAHAAAAGTMLLWITILGIWLQTRFTRRAERFVTVSGKGFRGAPVRLGRMAWLVHLFLGTVVACAVVLPFGALILMSVMRYSAPMITLDLLTLQHYKALFENPILIRSLINTFVLAVVSGAVCMAIGFLISYRDVRRPGAASRALTFLGILPIAIPGMVYGIGLIWAYLQTPLYGTVGILLLAYLAKFLPYGILVSRTGVLQLHPELEQSARMCGARSGRVLTAITMPLMKPTLVAIFFFVMLMAIKELSASILLYTNESVTLSVLTWNYMDAGNYQFAAAIGVVQTIIILAIIIVTRAVFNVSLQKNVGKG